MSNHGMWKVLKTLSLQFRNPWSHFPYFVSVNQRHITQLVLSRKEKVILKLSAVILLIHTIYCFLCLCWGLKQLSLNLRRGKFFLVRIYQLFFLTLLPLCFLAMNFIIAITTEVIPCVLNPISGFQRRIQSNYIFIFWTFHPKQKGFIN